MNVDIQCSASTSTVDTQTNIVALSAPEEVGYQHVKVQAPVDAVPVLDKLPEEPIIDAYIHHTSLRVQTAKGLFAIPLDTVKVTVPVDVHPLDEMDCRAQKVPLRDMAYEAYLRAIEPINLSAA